MTSRWDRRDFISIFYFTRNRKYSAKSVTVDLYLSPFELGVGRNNLVRLKGRRRLR